MIFDHTRRDGQWFPYQNTFCFERKYTTKTKENQCSQGWKVSKLYYPLKNRFLLLLRVQDLDSYFFSFAFGKEIVAQSYENRKRWIRTAQWITFSQQRSRRSKTAGGVGEKFDSNDFVKSGGVMGEEVWAWRKKAYRSRYAWESVLELGGFLEKLFLESFRFHDLINSGSQRYVISFGIHGIEGWT